MLDIVSWHQETISPLIFSLWNWGHNKAVLLEVQTKNDGQRRVTWPKVLRFRARDSGDWPTEKMSLPTANFHFCPLIISSLLELLQLEKIQPEVMVLYSTCRRLSRFTIDRPNTMPYLSRLSENTKDVAANNRRKLMMPPMSDCTTNFFYLLSLLLSLLFVL